MIKNNHVYAEPYQDLISRIYPEFNKTYITKNGTKKKSLTRTITFQVTDACNLACKYCYQINKGHRKMSFDTAKKFIDLLLSGEKGLSDYINPEMSPAIILDFIGGEPLLEIELIEQIVDYFFKECIRLDHPWTTRFRISMCSNGVLYRDPKVQRFLTKYKDNISFSVTLDGNRELHDSCRVFPDGSPSYDYAIDAIEDWMSRGYYMGSKITIAPNNVIYVYDAIKHMVELGYVEINANCVFEKGWENSHATEFYYQLKRVADYFLANPETNKIYFALFSRSGFHPLEETDLDNWCGGTGDMLAVDPDGKIYPCLRYMESSLGNEVPPIIIGDVDNGIGFTKQQRDHIKCLNCITRRTQSTDECFYCPIAKDCSWCSAYNYQSQGTPNKRATYICCMHKARALANAYYWAKREPDVIYDLYIPKNWALEIISEKEWEELLSLGNINYKGE